MSCRFTLLTGAAGTGKTSQCIREAVSTLKTSPSGKPLLFILPRQSTFQMEQAVYSNENGIVGSTRLQIVSFERLSLFLLKLLGQNVLQTLDDESHSMLVQALLLKERKEPLQFYQDHSDDPSLSTQIARILTLIQQQNQSPEKIHQIADGLSQPRLRRKIHDLAVLLDEYQSWIKSKKILDTDHSLDQVIQAVRDWHRSHPQQTLIQQIWLDGFTDLPPQHFELLSALADVTEQMTFAVCINTNELGENISTRPLWNFTYPLFQKIQTVAKEETQMYQHSLDSNSTHGRFKGSTSLRYLENNWLASPAKKANEDLPPPARDIEIFRCSEPWDEAVLIARKITEFVQDPQSNHRYRDCFVAFRNLQDYQNIFRNVFRHYNIPFFLDIPQSIAHHPAVELTLHFLYTAAFGWEQEVLLSIFKSELAGLTLDEADMIENELIKHNFNCESFWKKEVWKKEFEHSRKKETLIRLFGKAGSLPVSALIQFEKDISGDRPENSVEDPLSQVVPSQKIAKAILRIWQEFDLSRQLEEWSASQNDPSFAIESGISPKIHRTVWTRMESWLRIFQLAFQGESYTLEKWYEIIQTGFSGLTAAAIPPSLDQVVLGSIDRSRSQNVKLMAFGGMNDDVFPYLENESTLFSNEEIKFIDPQKIKLDLSAHEKKQRENYHSYIAFTRPSEKLIITYSNQNAEGNQLTPSRYIKILQENFKYNIHDFAGKDLMVKDCISECELSHFIQQEEKIPSFTVTEDSILRYYENDLHLSVSKLETYAKCPFSFFVEYILRSKEREEWTLGRDKLGTFTHKALEIFHHKVIEKESTWRDFIKNAIDSGELENIIQKCVEEASHFVFNEDQDDTFVLEGGYSQFLQAKQKIYLYLRNLNNYFPTYKFDPALSELRFSPHPKEQFHWNIQNINGKGTSVCFKGTIDRIDIHQDEQNNLWLAVIDYKNSEHEFKENEFKSGLNLQLTAYLCALREDIEGILKLLKKTNISPDKVKMAGAFYLNLSTPKGKNGNLPEKLFQLRGRFDQNLILESENPILDCVPLQGRSRHFSVKTSKNGIYKYCKDPVTEEKLKELIDQTGEIILILSKNILNGQFPVAPKKDSKTSCLYCPARPVCRFDLRKSNFLPLVSLLQQSQ